MNEDKKPLEKLDLPKTAPVIGMERLEAALNEERNPYMEWHDGPDFSSVSAALSALFPGERQAADTDFIYSDRNELIYLIFRNSPYIQTPSPAPALT
ncbi:MAG: hypothetical protein MUD12_06225 [Spirochaetes bacterium]|jgi:hypothetical protein|nr:hypothetical protein [Spirochaetota bacterium]